MRNSSETRQLVIGLLWTLLSGSAFAEAPSPAVLAWNQAKLVASERPKEHMQGLTWSKPIVEVKGVLVGRALQPKVELEGVFDRDGWVLVRGEQQLVLNKGAFKVELPLLGEVTPVHLYAISPIGEVEDEKFVIVYKGWAQFGVKARELNNPKNSVLLGLGVTSIAYDQTGTENLSENALTLKASYQEVWRAPNWDYGFTGFVTLLPISKNRTDVTARFFGVNGRIGYALASIREPWRLSLMSGVYYTTMIVSGAPLGYTNVGGPMLYPVLRRILNDRDSVAGYLKYSPVTDGLQLLTLSNRELAFGVSWTRRNPGAHPIGASFDFADFAITADGIRAHSRTLSFGVSYGF